MNIAFYVSGKASRLRKIITGGNVEVLDSIKLIFSDDSQNKFLQDMNLNRAIEYQCLNYKDIITTPTESRSLILSNSLLRALEKHNIDYCFSFGAHILKGEIVSSYTNRIINFHPSLLPMFPGMNSIDQAIDSGAFVLGNTAHFIDSGIDTGPIIMQNIVSSDQFSQGGYDMVLDQQLIMFSQIFAWLKEDRLRVIDGYVRVEGADYGRSAFFPGLET